MLPDRPLLTDLPTGMAHYLDDVGDGSLLDLLQLQRQEVLELLSPLKPEHAELSYASGKWTLSQLLVHMADTEHVLMGRLRRLARADQSVMPAFDEDVWGQNSQLDLPRARALLLSQRDASLLQLVCFPAETWQRVCVTSDGPRPAPLLAWMIAGHMAHHLKILRERYQAVLPALGAGRVEMHLDPGLVIRDLRMEDADEIYRLTDANRDHLRRWLPWVDQVKHWRDTRSFIQRSREVWLATGLPTCVIEVEGRARGLVDLHASTQRGVASVGYWLDKEAQGQGLVTRATRALVGYGFSQLGLRRIEIHCAEGNLPSRSIPGRLGFSREGVHEAMQALPEGPVDLVVYAMLADRWPDLLP